MSSYNRTFKKNESFPSLDLKYEKGTPLAAWDLRNYTVTLRITNYSKRNVAKTQTIGNGLTLVGVGFNTIRTSSFLLDWKTGQYICEIWISNSDNSYVKVFNIGTIILTENV
jgi:hypothetical protein